MLDAQKIGDRIRQLRGAESQDSYARSIGVSGSAISMYENGRRVPRDEIKLAIANKAKKSVEEIFFI